MKRVHVTDHSDECKNQKPIEFFPGHIVNMHDACKLSYFEFVFYADFEFYLISVPNCILPNYLNEPEKKRMLIESLYKQKKLKYNVEKSWDAGKKLKAMLKGEAEINELKHEVNAIYENMTGKEYAIVTKKPFIDFVVNADTFRDNYNKSIKYLQENDKERFIPEVEDLFDMNAMYNLQPVILIKTIDHLTKQLKNGNNKIS
jgi:hypothetical protein